MMAPGRCTAMPGAGCFMLSWLRSGKEAIWALPRLRVAVPLAGVITEVLASVCVYV